MKKAQSFTDLIVWKKGHQFVLNIYTITSQFPISEKFGLTSQLRRAAVSVTSNIAEGFKRNTKKDKTQFYIMSLSSLTEIQNQLLIAKDIQYLQVDTFNTLAKDSVEIAKMMQGLINSLKTKSM